MLLAMQEGIIYGPVDSRRYGKSLGINLMPSSHKLCSFNCVYCHYGWTKRCTMEAARYEADLPAFDDVVSAVEQAVMSPVECNLITFSGNGEPTLYPRFAELVEIVVAFRNRYKPSARVALLSNSSGLVNQDIRDSVSKIDLPVFKLDAGTAEKFRAINRPARGVRFEQIVELLCSIENIYLQAVLMAGTPSNTEPDDLAAWFELLSRIRPREIHLYSIDRPVPDTEISLVPPERLEEIAQQILRETGVRARAFYERKQA